MHSLRELQLAFLDAVLADAPERAAPLIRARTHEASTALRIRLGVYSGNVVANATRALELGFPTVLALGGREWFEGAVREYLRAHPSRSGDLHWLGERFPAFLPDRLADGAHAYFADVARLEWAYQEVIVAAEAPPLDLAALARVPPERHVDLSFDVHPATRLVRSDAPILDLWRAHRAGAPPDCSVDVGSGGQCVLVIRRADHVELAALGTDEAALYDSFAAGCSLGRVVEALGDGFPLAGTLAALAARGTLSGFELGSPRPQP